MTGKVAEEKKDKKAGAGTAGPNAKAQRRKKKI
jgi:hypothetical protein